MPSWSWLMASNLREGDTPSGESPHGGRDIPDAPAEHGVPRVCHVPHRRHPEHGAVGVQDYREVAVFEYPQAEGLLIEEPGPV